MEMAGFLPWADKGIDNLLHAYKIIATSNEARSPSVARLHSSCAATSTDERAQVAIASVALNSSSSRKFSNEQRRRIQLCNHEVPDVPTSLPEDCRAAVLACFSRDVAQRPKAHQLRRFPWFSGTKAPAATVPVVHGHESSGPAAYSNIF